MKVPNSATISDLPDCDGQMYIDNADHSNSRPPPQLISDESLESVEKPQALLTFPVTSKDKTDEAQKSKCCRFCPQTRKGKFICVFCILAFLVTVICIAYFYIPRVPEFSVLYVNVRPVNGKIPLNISQLSINPTNISIQLPIFMGISVINPNRYDLTVDTFDLTAYIQPNVSELNGSGLPGTLMSTVSDSKVAYGVYGSRNFLSNDNTTFEIQILLNYTPDPTLGLLNDPAFGDLLQVCGIKQRSENRTMKIKYDVGIEISSLARLGIHPVLPNQVSIKCPLTEKHVDDLVNRFGMR
jgi:hypothetical protein